MLELVRAHATYRFVILDEEEEKPRALVCILSIIWRGLINVVTTLDLDIQAKYAAVLRNDGTIRSSTLRIRTRIKNIV